MELLFCKSELVTTGTKFDKQTISKSQKPLDLDRQVEILGIWQESNSRDVVRFAAAAAAYSYTS